MRRAARRKPAAEAPAEVAARPPKDERRASFRLGDEVTLPSGRAGRVVAVYGERITVRYLDTWAEGEECYMAVRYLARWQ